MCSLDNLHWLPRVKKMYYSSKFQIMTNNLQITFHNISQNRISILGSYSRLCGKPPVLLLLCTSAQGKPILHNRRHRSPVHHSPAQIRTPPEPGAA